MIKLGLAWSLVIWTLMIAVSVFALIVLPDEARLALHWDVQGTPGNYANKWSAAIALPLTAALMICFLALIPMLPGQRKVIEKSSQLFLTGWICSIAVLGFVHIIILVNALSGEQISLGLIIGFASLLLLLLGNAMARSKPNAWVGIRTPWTLRSNRSWIVANRTAGIGLMLTAVVTIMLATVSRDQWATYSYFIGNVVTLILSLALSYQAAGKKPYTDSD